jgi:hypothetical protein
MQVPLATSPTCSCRRRLISCRHATLWQVLGTELCWAGVSCVTSRLSCDASLSQISPTLLPMCDTRVIHYLYQHLIWCCLRRMLPVCSRGATLCDCVSVSLAVLVLKLCAVTLWLHLHLSSEESKVLCDCSALPSETWLRRPCVNCFQTTESALHILLLRLMRSLAVLRLV